MIVTLLLVDHQDFWVKIQSHLIERFLFFFCLLIRLAEQETVCTQVPTSQANRVFWSVRCTRVGWIHRRWENEQRMLLIFRNVKYTYVVVYTARSRFYLSRELWWILIWLIRSLVKPVAVVEHFAGWLERFRMVMFRVLLSMHFVSVH